MTAQEIIDQLRLEPLRDEGGYFTRVFTHPMRIQADSLPEGYHWSRELMTIIYYLVTPDNFSALHRIRATETYHYHGGDALEMLLLSENGPCGIHRIGMQLKDGQVPLVTVPGGTWQGTHLPSGGTYGWALLSVVVSPGFDWDEFELANRSTLCAQFPEWKEHIATLTR